MRNFLECLSSVSSLIKSMLVVSLMLVPRFVSLLANFYF